MKNRNVKLSLFVLAFLVFFASCTKAPKFINPELKTFFDLKGYFDGEFQRLHSKGKAKKIVMAGGKQEVMIMDSIDFKRELGVFSGSDINRPAWSDKYVVDSSFNEQKELVQLQFNAIDNKLKTRKILVDFEKAAVTKVFIENITSSSIATSSQVLTYEPNLGYAIESHQKVAMTDDQHFKVTVQFLK